ISQYQSETAPIFSAVARELKCAIEFADKNYKVVESVLKNGHRHVKIVNRDNGETITLELDLTGSYQVKNVLGVITLLQFIGKAGYIVEMDNVRDALKNVTKLTGLKGRWQTLSEKPLVIADTGHNEDGIRQITGDLANEKFDQLHIVFGAVRDKDTDKVLQHLPKKAHYYFVRANIPRALNENELLASAKKHKLRG